MVYVCVCVRERERGGRVTVGWLVGRWLGWILWNINLCRLFNAKSIFD